MNISKIFQIWISTFGPPRQILSDNGGEFANDDFRIMAEKPIVTFPLASEFNESVAMDLKQVSGKLVLHLIDHATRFSSAGVISSKDGDVNISKIFQIWISTFGLPKQILSDNGGEFANDDFRIMAEKLNTTVRTTAAESPWSNGINERHNATLENMDSKVMSDTGCSLDIAVSWAVASKNTLANVYGYSPNQLVFGRNPNFPSTLIDKLSLPALETATHFDIVLKNLTAMRAARKAFIESEAKEKLCRTLRHQTHQSTPYIFQNGDSVYFKRDSSNEWKGLGTVIGIDNQTLLIKHGSVYVCVHPCWFFMKTQSFCLMLMRVASEKINLDLLTWHHGQMRVKPKQLVKMTRKFKMLKIIMIMKVMITMLLLRMQKMKVVIAMLLLRAILMSPLGPEIIIIMTFQIMKTFKNFLHLCFLQ